MTVWFDGGFEEVAFEATYRVVDETTVATEECGDTTFRYTIDGERISFNVIDNHCVDDIMRLFRAVNLEPAPFELVVGGTP